MKNSQTKAKKDKMDKVKHAPRVGTSNLADQSSSTSSASRNLQGDFIDERQRARKGQIVSDLDSLDSIVNKIDKMRVVSTSSSANMASEFGTTETVRDAIPFSSYKRETAAPTKSFKKEVNKQRLIGPKTREEIDEAIRKASVESLRAIGLKGLTYGFIFNQIVTAMLDKKVGDLLSEIIKKDRGNECTAENAITHLGKLDNRVINEILKEIEDESARFDDNMKLDQISQISQFSQEVLDMGRHRMHFLFTYVRLYQKLGNALKWNQLNNQISSVDHQKLLNWLNTLVNGLLPTLSEKAISHNFSFASEWFEKLGRLENAIELTNFGILLILSPDAWELFGVDRPTKVKGLPEKIGRQKIFKQFDANCDLSSIEQIAQKTWITLDKMGNNVVLGKIKNIFIKMIIQMKQRNAETLSIKKPAKIILFLGILPQIHNELANSEFDKLYEPKLAEERANGLHFLAKCLEILDAECDLFEKGVQKELGDLAKLRKKHLECATKKRTKAEGKSADNPIEL